MTALRVNALVAFVAESRTERVLWLDPLGRGGFLIDLDDAAAMPVFRSSEEVDRLRSDALLTDATDDPWRAPLAEATIPEGHRARRDAAWSLIRPLVAEQPDIFHPDRRALLVRRVIAETGSNRFTLYRLLRRFWQRGLSPNALLPDYDRCGGRGKAKAASEKKRGRVSATGIAGVNVDADMRRLFRDTVTRHFAANRRLDMAGCYDELIDHHFTDLRLDEDVGRQKAVIRADLPTLRQFRYWFEKDNDVFRIERQRRTARVYDKDLRALLNTSTSEVFGPGSRYQIDATIADVYLVSRLNRRRIVGRPVLYVVIDVFSRMITGLYIGFEGPSWVGAMMAIANAATDKVAYCRSFGIEIGEVDWPCHHMPDRLLGDRGEMIGSAVETLIQNFHVEIENTAPYRADWKGIVEQRFRLLPAKFRAYTPGYIEGDFQQRGARDYRLDGTLDIDKFTAIVIQCARYYNTQHLLRGYPRDAQMIAEDVKAIPIELWEWGVARRSGQLRAYGLLSMRSLLGPAARNPYPSLPLLIEERIGEIIFVDAVQPSLRRFVPRLGSARARRRRITTVGDPAPVGAGQPMILDPLVPVTRFAILHHEWRRVIELTGGAHHGVDGEVEVQGIGFGIAISGKGNGRRWFNPKNPRGDWVRVMPGKPNNSNEWQREPYVRWHKDGVYRDGVGNPVSNGKTAEETHIPLDQFKFKP